MSLAAAKRQTNGGGPAFNGVFGVDSQDILNAPQIDFGTFQLFPDQNNYGTTGIESQAPSADFDNTLSQTNAWITSQADSALRYVFLTPIANASHLRPALCSIGKPVILTAFGLVTQDNLQQFVPFNAESPVEKSPWKRKSRFCTSLDWHLCNKILIVAIFRPGHWDRRHRCHPATSYHCVHRLVAKSVLFYENEKSIANDRVFAAGLTGGVSGMSQYQASDWS